MTAEPAVTVFLPTWNAGAGFPEIFARLRAQRLDRPFELLVIDSGSTDGTVEFLREQMVRLIEIPHAEFNHGATRNRAIREAHGDIVVLTVQDALPADDEWLQRLVDALQDDDTAGAYSRQIPRQDANPFVRDRLQRWHAADLTPRVQAIGSREEFEALVPLEKMRRVAFDNVSSAVRRRIALEIAFHPRPFGEDLDWAYRVLMTGYKIAYEPRSMIIHSHNRSTWYESKRVYLDHQNLRRLFGLSTVPSRRQVMWQTLAGGVRLLGVVAKAPALTPSARLGWWARALPHSFAQTLAQYLGARSADPAGGCRRLYRWLDRRLGQAV